MKEVYLYSQIGLLFFLLISSNSSSSQTETFKGQSIGIEVGNIGGATSYGEHDKVTSGILDKKGNLWFGTSNEGVFRYDGKSFVNFAEQDGLSSNYVNCIVEDREGTIWFGTKNGLSKYDGKHFSHVTIPMDDDIDRGEGSWWNANEIQSMLEDSIGNLWIGTCGYGAYRFDGKDFTNFSFSNDMKQSDSLHHNFIQSMIEDSNGNIWFTSLTHGGVSRYDGKEFTHFSTSDGLMDDMVYSSFQDRDGNLWFGSIQTKHEGLYRYDGKSFTGFGKEDGLCDNFVTGFFEDRKNKLWIRTGSILCIYDGETFAPFITEKGEKLKNIGFVVEDKDHNIWLGGKYGHIWKYDGKVLIDYTHKREGCKCRLNRICDKGFI